MRGEHLYTLREIHTLKKKLFRRAWQVSGENPKVYAKLKQEIRKKVKFKLHIEREVDLHDVLGKIVTALEGKEQI